MFAAIKKAFEVRRSRRIDGQHLKTQHLKTQQTQHSDLIEQCRLWLADAKKNFKLLNALRTNCFVVVTANAWQSSRCYYDNNAISGQNVEQYYRKTVDSVERFVQLYAEDGWCSDTRYKSKVEIATSRCVKDWFGIND